ncbi:MAG: hypothetical protein HY465_05895 [Deltaproteobacteria bacterium]|nr:hypothetical protein [Deltaproteobacteria bacterium]
MAPVTIPGLETLPNKFSFTTEQINVQERGNANRHNEVGAFIECGEEGFNLANWGANDSINVNGWTTQSGYQLDIKFDSEADILLFQAGRVVLDWDAATETWSIKGYVPGEKGRREWKFCDVEATIDVVLAAFDCYYQSSQDIIVTSALSALSESIQDHMIDFSESAVPYEDATDCSANPNDGVPHFVD